MNGIPVALRGFHPKRVAECEAICDLDELAMRVCRNYGTARWFGLVAEAIALAAGQD